MSIDIYPMCVFAPEARGRWRWRLSLGRDLRCRAPRDL